MIILSNTAYGPAGRFSSQPELARVNILLKYIMFLKLGKLETNIWKILHIGERFEANENNDCDL